MGVKMFLDDKKEIVNPELFVTEAKNYADKFRHEGINKSQIRRYYNEVLQQKMKVELFEDNNKNAFSKQLPYIKMIIPKAFYSRSRGNVGDEFIKFISEYLRPITAESSREFFVFCDLFEAIVAYYAEN